MMRIAVAGTNGLASWIAYFIEEHTPHQVLVLSRTSQPSYEARGLSVQVVDYTNTNSLRYALKGIDIVVSTILGEAQLTLIDAAVRAGVRRFVPAEFEGPPRLRPNDMLDRGRRRALQRLDRYRNHIESTIFICGIFYERFQPGGLAASTIGRTSCFSSEGDYMLDIRHMTAEAPPYNPNGGEAMICMTSVKEVALFVVRALDLDRWPPELRVYGERVSIVDLLNIVTDVRDQRFEPMKWHDERTLMSQLNQAIDYEDYSGQGRTQALIATAQGQYDFDNPNLRQFFPNIPLTDFQQWIQRAWNL